MHSLNASDDRTPLSHRYLLLLALSISGIATAGISWILYEVSGWWSAFLSNTAVVILLLVPGELAISRVRSQLNRVKRTADQAESIAESALKTADQVAQSLEDVRNKIIARQHAEYQSNLDTYRLITADPSRESLLRALRCATDDGLITTAGVRSPIWETALHYRFVINDESAELMVQVEHDNGKVIQAIRWDPGITPEDFYQQLVNAVRNAGGDLGVGLNDPTLSVEDLSDMLIEATRHRSQALLGHRHTLQKIIERREGWYFTEHLIAPADRLSYTISVNRLGESDWERHLLTKPWYSAPGTIEFARALYGITGSSDLSAR